MRQIEKTKAERLQKIIASTGLCSRRSAEEMIASGRVTVNGKRVTRLGSKADPYNDEIKVDNKKLVIPHKRNYTYCVLNKPSGCITSMTDPFGRPTTSAFLPKKHRRLKPVGRLDFNTEGILIFTDDGDLIHRITHPSYGVRRKYLVRAKGVIDRDKFYRIVKKGVMVDTVRIKNIGIRDVRYTSTSTWFEIEIGEGKNREVRKIVEKLGSEVSRLKRIAYGSVYKNIPPKGKYRELTKKEVEELYTLVKLERK